MSFNRGRGGDWPSKNSNGSPSRSQDYNRNKQSFTPPFPPPPPPPPPGQQQRSQSQSKSPQPSLKSWIQSGAPSQQFDRRRRTPSPSPPRGRSPRHSRRDSRERRSNGYRRSRSRSRSGSRDRYRRRRRSSSSGHRRRHRSRSAKRSPSRSLPKRNRSRSPSKNRFGRQYTAAPAGTVLGVFGISTMTTSADLEKLFAPYGRVVDVQLVMDRFTRRSRGFGFVYFTRLRDATTALKECNGMTLDGRRIRVDYSITPRAHTPTPGRYMGSPNRNFLPSGRHLFRSPSRSPRRH